MTIKEIEERSGLQRANIRFYEQEGLISPRRQSNGYREYSEEDLRQLQRILLLRTLGLSLDEIRALQKGEASLSTVLDRQALSLEQQASQTHQRATLCRRIQQDGAQYDTLDGQRWLDALEVEEPAAVTVPQADTYHKVTAPWRRFFARLLDDYLYGSLWVMVGLLVIHKSPATDTGAGWSAVGGLMAIILMVLIEPLFLSTWGTTPGKWLLGLSVRNNTGQKLSYTEGLYRTVQALWYGFGFWLPIYSLIRGYKCYYDCVEGKTLEWEWDSELTLKDEESWRIVAVVGAVVLLILARTGSVKLAAMPPHRGHISVAEFSQNYNRLAGYHDLQFWLDKDGQWTSRYSSDQGIVISFNDIEPPNFTYTEENGVMTGLSFALKVNGNTESYVPTFVNRRIAAVLAYVQAQAPLLETKQVDALVKEMEEQPFTPIDRTVHGVHITYDLVYSGYYEGLLGSALVPIEGQNPSCTMTFTMKKVS